MDQYLTANVATNLYWLGRYLERIEATLNKIVLIYDDIIDVNKNAGKELYDKFDINIEYKNAKEFLEVSINGDHSANIYSLTGYVRENAIISRNHLNTEGFGEIIALHALFESVSKHAIIIDYKLIDNAKSLISEIWGELFKRDQIRTSDYFLKLGKLVEELDFNFRFEYDENLSQAIVEKIDTTINFLSSQDQSEHKQIQHLNDTELLMQNIYNKIADLIVE